MNRSEYTEFRDVLVYKSRKSGSDGFKKGIKDSIETINRLKRSSGTLDGYEYDMLKYGLKHLVEETSSRITRGSNYKREYERGVLCSLSKLKELNTRRIRNKEEGITNTKEIEFYKLCTHELVSMLRGYSISAYGSVSLWMQYVLWSEGDYMVLDYRDLHIKFLEENGVLVAKEAKNLKGLKPDTVAKVVESCIKNLVYLGKPISVLRGLPSYNINKARISESATEEGTLAVILFEE